MILSGGAINSPQLLQLSGIGPGALCRTRRQFRSWSRTATSATT
ncbi:MAG: GMC family oxidoreductase N-terminal domain-containing protein [Paracoccaceae bacterium]